MEFCKRNDKDRLNSCIIIQKNKMKGMAKTSFMQGKQRDENENLNNCDTNI